VSIEKIKATQNDELKKIKPVNHRRLIQFAVIMAMFLAFVSIVPNSKDFVSFDSASKAAKGISRAQLFIDSMQQGSAWLVTHGTQLEVSLYETIGEKLYHFIESAQADSMFFTPLVAVCEGILRVCFILIASFRLWLLLIAWGVYRSVSSFKPYVGPDLLGETGTGKFFYSGINANLSNVTEAGAPDKLVTNLACLRKTESSDAVASKLISILRKHGVVNKTGTWLCSILAAYPDVPFYAPRSDSTTEKASQISLIDGTLQFLDNVLTDFSTFINSNNSFASVENLTPVQRVINPFCEDLSKIHLVEVAVTVLAIQCGKVMGYLKEGNRWVRRSSYIHLNARSVIHSVPHFQVEFNAVERDRIRQALVYGNRFTVFGPIRLPIELPDSTRGLRQLVELSLAPSDPDIGAQKVNEIELYGISYRLYRRFESRIIDDIYKRSPLVTEQTYSTDSGLVAFPVSALIKLFDELVTRKEQECLFPLVTKVTNYAPPVTRIDDDDEPAGPLPQSQKFFAGFDSQSINQMAKVLNLDVNTLQKWGYYRNILNAFGWLARQVGSTVVPDSSVVFAVFKGVDTGQDLLGKVGYVPCRSTAIERNLGKSWRKYFINCESALVTDLPEQYEKFLTGFDPTEEFIDG
jgi:hypothetical protein